jgi:hypothetical protein
MSPLPIIVDFEILEKRLSGLLMGDVDGVPHALLLERAEEGFHYRIIPTIAFPRHAYDHPCLLQSLTVRAAGLLAASITVMQESRLRTATAYCHLQSPGDELFITGC